MAEEHRCQAPQPCANNCGFFGTPATLDLCPKCYRDLQLKQQHSSDAKLALNQTLASTSPSPISTAVSSSPSVATPSPSQEDREAAVAAAPRPSRCLTCRRRVGLTGFKCRCGITFCGTHRYPERHGCTFDYKAMGRDQIAKANPVVIAEKLQRI